MDNKKYYPFKMPGPLERGYTEVTANPFGHLPRHVPNHEVKTRQALDYLLVYPVTSAQFNGDVFKQRVNQAVGIANRTNSPLTVSTAFGLRCISLSIVRAIEMEYLVTSLEGIDNFTVQRVLNVLKKVDVIDNHIFVKNQKLLARYCTYFLMLNPGLYYAKEVYQQYVLNKAIKQLHSLEFHYEFDCFSMMRLIVKAIETNRVSDQIINLCIYLRVMNQDYLYLDTEINPYVVFRGALDNNYHMGVCHNNMGFLFHYGVRKYILNFNFKYNQSIKKDLIHHLNTAPGVNGTLKHYILNNFYVSRFILFFIPKSCSPLHDSAERPSNLIVYPNENQAMIYYKKARLYENINAFNNIINLHLFDMSHFMMLGKQSHDPHSHMLYKRSSRRLSVADTRMIYNLFHAGLHEGERDYIPLNFALFLMRHFYFPSYSKVVHLLLLGIDECTSPRSYRQLTRTLQSVSESMYYKIFVPKSIKTDVQVSMLFNVSCEIDDEVEFLEMVE